MIENIAILYGFLIVAFVIGVGFLIFAIITMPRAREKRIKENPNWSSRSSFSLMVRRPRVSNKAGLYLGNCGHWRRFEAGELLTSCTHCMRDVYWTYREP